jgi:hypothetical protein
MPLPLRLPIGAYEGTPVAWVDSVHVNRGTFYRTRLVNTSISDLPGSSEPT